jgi:DNA modification methylase
MNKIYLGENLEFLRGLQDSFVDICYIDPPFNTGAVARELGRNFILCDSSRDAYAVMQRRFQGVGDIEWSTCSGNPKIVG